MKYTDEVVIKTVGLGGFTIFALARHDVTPYVTFTKSDDG